MDDDKLFLNEYSNLSSLLGATNSTSLGAEACPADASDCSTDSCPSDCKNDCSDCGSDCSSDCSSDCRSDCSDTPSYLVLVYTYLDGSFYDGNGGSYVSQSRTVSSWKSLLGVDSPPNSTFKRGEYSRGSTSGTCTLSTSLRNSADLTILLFYETDTPIHTPITITGGSINPTTITSGSSVTFSWTATGDYETIGSWQLRRTTSSSFTDPVEIGSKTQGGSKSFTMDAWGPTGTYYIWVFYYGETGSTEYTSNIYKIGTLTVNPSPVTYTLSVYSYLNNSVYDSSSVTNIVSGTSKTCFQWVTDAGVDLPPSPAVFKKYTWGANDFTDTTIQLSVSSNISLKVYYTDSTSNVEVYIFHNGDWCLTEPDIKTNGDWALTAADIFDDDWQNT